MAKRFCDVALPVPLRSTFTYAIPESVQLENEALIGRRVLVPFRNKPVAGVIVSLATKALSCASHGSSLWLWLEFA